MALVAHFTMIIAEKCLVDTFRERAHVFFTLTDQAPFSNNSNRSTQMIHEIIRKTLEGIVLYIDIINDISIYNCRILYGLNRMLAIR